MKDYEQHITPKQTGQNENIEADLRRRFSPLSTTSGCHPSIEFRPAVVTDADGEIIMWYLPNLFSKEMTVSDSI